MLKLLIKKAKLAASPLSYIFIAFGLMSFLPGYPILVGTFFVGLGLFQSFQCMREANDIAYTALLPVAKGDIVRAKYIFCLAIEDCYFILTSIPVLLRMTLLSEAAVYRQNAMMNANLVYLGFVLLILGSFNLLFVGGFFKTAYRFGKPFYRRRFFHRRCRRISVPFSDAFRAERVWLFAHGIAGGRACRVHGGVYADDRPFSASIDPKL